MREEDAEGDALELDRLVRFMTRSGRPFGLALATYADARVAEAVREQARARASGRRSVTLELGEVADDLVAALATASARAEVVFLVGLDALSTDLEGTSAQTLAIVNLNLRRDELPELLAARVVLWIAREGLEQLASLAWDLLEVMLLRFDFQATLAASEEGAPTRGGPETRAKLSGWAAPVLDEDEGQGEARVEWLLDVVRAAGDTGAPATIADASASAGRLLAGRGRLEEAERELERAAASYEAAGAVAEAARQRLRLAEVASVRGARAQARAQGERALDLATRALDGSEDARREQLRALILLAELDAGERSKASDSLCSDAQLLEAWRGGDLDAARELIARHLEALRRYFRARVGEGAEVSATLVEDTFSSLFAGGQQRLYDLARRVLAQRYRGEAQGSALDFAFFDRSAFDAQTRPRVRAMGQTLSQAFERLAFDEQDLLGLRYFEGLSLADLSALEKVREGTVQARVSRALAHLGELCQEIAGSAAVPSPARLEGELRALAASRGRLE